MITIDYFIEIENIEVIVKVRFKELFLLIIDVVFLPIRSKEKR
tara:strand:+ start:5181 stop:5309 length:129 start_codon:yes stop_codon:yes gene_type:complete